MGRKRKGLTINGWINLDKPAGMTSAAEGSWTCGTSSALRVSRESIGL